MKALPLLLLLLGLPAGAVHRVPLCERPEVPARASTRPFSEELERALDAFVRAELEREPHAGWLATTRHLLRLRAEELVPRLRRGEARLAGADTLLLMIRA